MEVQTRCRAFRGPETAGRARVPRAHPLCSCLAERTRLLGSPGITSFTCLGCSPVTVAELRPAISFSFYTSETEMPTMVHARFLTASSYGSRSQLLTHEGRGTQRTETSLQNGLQKKNVSRNPEITEFEMSKYHLRFPELALQVIWARLTAALRSDPR